MSGIYHILRRTESKQCANVVYLFHTHRMQNPDLLFLLKLVEEFKRHSAEASFDPRVQEARASIAGSRSYGDPSVSQERREHNRAEANVADHVHARCRRCFLDLTSGSPETGIPEYKSQTLLNGTSTPSSPLCLSTTPE